MTFMTTPTHATFTTKLWWTQHHNLTADALSAGMNLEDLFDTDSEGQLPADCIYILQGIERLGGHDPAG